MTKLIKTFLKRKQAEPTLEEMIAFKTATMALQVRVEQIARLSNPVL